MKPVVVLSSYWEDISYRTDTQNLLQHAADRLVSALVTQCIPLCVGGWGMEVISSGAGVGLDGELGVTFEAWEPQQGLSMPLLCDSKPGTLPFFCGFQAARCHTAGWETGGPPSSCVVTVGCFTQTGNQQGKHCFLPLGSGGWDFWPCYRELRAEPTLQSPTSWEVLSWGGRAREVGRGI